MDEKWYDMIHAMNESKVGLHWFCQDCDAKAIDMVQSFTQMKTRQDEMESKMEAMEKKLNDILEMKDDTYAKKVKNIAREESFDISEREKRALNLVISGLPEVEHQNDTEKKAKENMDLVECADDQDIIAVFAEKVGLEADMIETCTRIPEKRREDGPPRYMLVKMKSLGAKRQMLDKARTYRENSESYGYKKVYVNNDLTRQERNRQYNLRQELRRRRDAGEKDIMIKGDEIVKRDVTANSTRTDNTTTRGGAGGGGSAASGDHPQ
jgi:vacuolar-type H+-ATPase subunit I/STV1